MSKKSKREAAAKAAQIPDNVTFMSVHLAKKFYANMPPAPPERPAAPVTSMAQFKADKESKKGS